MEVSTMEVSKFSTMVFVALKSHRNSATTYLERLLLHPTAMNIIMCYDYYITRVRTPSGLSAFLTDGRYILAEPVEQA